ncbi:MULTISPECIES: hypothetical protein [unclassified Streptomyces]|uniref:hypothetical protein n=1 Tax=unclassified Streptomyces TaxID=2593676 RepID=UPI0006FE5D7F|nr:MULTISPECIES: hypothetical protein [unclassified Streptomyces]KQX47943.1 hypothetical protein ASD33_19660 [Streptomyces sp. Root1304]KRA82334.1 hypothetical protein ASE09_14615 [Streptomyces sp. Root66D1]
MPADHVSFERANRLAELLGDARGAEILGELQKADLARARAPKAPADPSPCPAEAAAGRTERLGIWSIVSGPAGSELRLRGDESPSDRSWADTGDTPGKGAARRVAVVGESTARGYLFDPFFTPTLMLQEELDASAGPGRHQCVDLARTGAGLGDLEHVVSALPSLDTDVLVLMAGNNWCLQPLSYADGDLLGRSMRAGGIRGVREAFTRSIVLPRVRALLRKVRQVAQAGLDVVVVVPEFNLREWEPDEAWTVGVLSPERAEEWRGLHDSARRALRERRWEALPELCDRMALLDEGCSPVPGRLRGIAQYAMGDFPGARESWEKSRDSVVGQLLGHTPRVIGEIQELLCSFAEKHGFALVDLRGELVAPETGLPDPEHFLDYCHLSTTGMRAVARAVAGKIASPSGDVGRATGGPRQADEEGSSREAVGHLLAACHNAWHGQPAATLRRHVEVAVSDHAGHEAAAALLKLMAKTAPAWTTPEYDRLCSFAHAERYLNPVATSTFAVLAQSPLGTVLADLLGVPVPLSPVHRTDGSDLRRVNLLAGRRDEATGLAHGPGAAYSRSARKVWRSTVHTGDASALHLSLRYRTPHADEAGRPGWLEVNGRRVAELSPLRETWGKIDAEVPAERVNEIAVHWPASARPEDDWRQEVATALETGRLLLPLPVFGELHEADVRF